MNKRIFSILLCLVTLLGIIVPVSADEEENQSVVRTLSISTIEEFLEFAENCRLDSFSQNLEVSLEENIDLSGTSFNGVPIFSGTLKGKGHKITGLSITDDGSHQGLFRYLTKDAVVRDLVVEGEIYPSGSANVIGAIAGSNAGSILHCEFKGSVSGNDYVGGIVGKNTVTGIVENCMADGQVHGDHFVGGISGENSGVVRKSVNYAAVNTTSEQNTVTFSDITMETMMNSEAANTATDIGGISGSSNGVIRDCKNRGNIGYQRMGYNIGGIAGTQLGYIYNCINYGEIQGRKEVGGIVGQMEPAMFIEFETDSMQILQEQLDTMSGLINKATSSALGSDNQISNEISALQTQANTAKEAVEMLTPNMENLDLPDVDTILAAQNVLADTMYAMPRTVERIASTSQSMISNLLRDMDMVSKQMERMNQTIQNGAEGLGGNITDISDLDTPELLNGKVETCVNHGVVFGELNVGGISGAMAIENDTDILEDWQQNGENSLNFQSEVRAVVLDCGNYGVVNGVKQNIGGLVGLQSLGLVKQSVNTGKVDGTGAEYVGGIAGQSVGYLRNVCVNCEVIGDAYLGGIAGSAMIVTDALSKVKLLNGTERVGAILGWLEENQTEEEIPVRDNYYMQLENDPGAIDGISYFGLAEPMDSESFLLVEGLPETFHNVKIRFCFEDGSVSEIELPAGDDFNLEDVPPIPEKDGLIGFWHGLEQAQMTDILFDMTFELEYVANIPTIESIDTASEGRPVVLLEGMFTNEATVTVTVDSAAPDLEKNQRHLESWKITSNELGTTVHLLLNDSYNTEDLLLYACGADGVWQQMEYHIAGSYAVFAMDAMEMQIALLEQNSYDIFYLIGAGGLAVIFVAVVFILRKRKKNANVVTVTE